MTNAQANDETGNANGRLQSGVTRPSGCTCQECGQNYKMDVLVKDEIWEDIKPGGKGEGAGLLCPNCIVSMIEERVGYSAYRLKAV